jgi:hypothetical protein
MKKALVYLMFALGCFSLFATSFGEVEKICAVCGAKGKYTVLMSTNAMGARDLDGRPPEMMRSTISFGVEKCPACGYCSEDVAKLIKDAKATMADPAYKSQLSNAAYPELANKFLCKMMIEDKAGEYKIAANSAINAGWTSDDAKNTEAAAAIREISIKRLLDLNSKNDRYFTQKGGDEILISDMWRRNSQFEKARQAAEKGLTLELEEVIKSVLNFELALIDKKDTAIHTMAEIAHK